MRIIDISIHPNYIVNGDQEKFYNGTDIALAVVEIPAEKYMAIKDKDLFQ